MKKTFLLLCITAPCYAGLITHTDYTSGNVITASGQNANENTIVNEINGNLDSTNLAANAVGTTQIAAGAVTSAKIAATTITNTNLATTAAQDNLRAQGISLVYQRVLATVGASSSTTSNAYTATSLSGSITPSSTAHKILIFMSGDLQSGNVNTSNALLTITRNTSTNLSGGQFAILAASGVSTAMTVPVSVVYLDSPSSTSALTYTVAIKNGDNSTSVSFCVSTSCTLILEEVD